jgi:nucleoside-diphosphate-sugar epimerase
MNKVASGYHPPAEDLTEIVDLSLNSLELLKDAKILLSGGTGFIGNWLVCALLKANKELNLNLSITIVSRNVNAATKKFTNFQSGYMSFVEADLSFDIKLELNTTTEFTHFIHAGVMVASPINHVEERYIEDSSLNGAKIFLELARNQGNVPNFIHLSSGAVYDRSDLYEGKFQEVGIQKGNNKISSYGRAKSQTEFLIDSYGDNGFVKQSNPRLFAFFGPGLPLDKQFAIGNFIQDALTKDTITVKGNPNTIRSYMYPVDLITWLLATIASPTNRSLNIGSPVPIAIGDLAQTISSITGSKKVVFSNPIQDRTVYVPSVDNMTSIYGVKATVALETGLHRWINWLASNC